MRIFTFIVYIFLRVIFKVYFKIVGEPKFNKNITKTIRLYAENDFTGWFKNIRFWDAPYSKVEKLIPDKGQIVELGCGEGMFSNYLAISSSRRKVFGFDIDRTRIKQADRGLKNTIFKKADVTKLNLPQSDCIVMFHLLHHLLSPNLQTNLIKKSINSLKKDGKLIIVEINNKPFFKYLVTWLTDHLLIAWLFEKRLYEPNIYFRSEKQWLKLFSEFDLKCKVYSVNRNMPFSHIIFECSKPQTK